jgi:hypothetical protein
MSQEEEYSIACHKKGEYDARRQYSSACKTLKLESNQLNQAGCVSLEATQHDSEAQPPQLKKLMMRGSKGGLGPWPWRNCYNDGIDPGIAIT